MVDQRHDEAFSKYVLQAGVVRIEHLEAARSEQARTGKPVSEILVAQGVITALQRQDFEKRLSTGLNDAPQQLGNYRLLCKLGEGGMGAVFLCVDTLLDRQVAVKILPKDVTDSPELLSRFRREAIAAGKLNHANIATAYAVGEESGRHFYVMEYCRGESLDKMLERLKHLPEKQVAELSIPVARALQYAHDHGILHRDVKPANILRAMDGTVKVLDLGLAKNLTDNARNFQTTSGLVVGTPYYISPEQARGEKVLDGRTDVYSLGATMFHLATGRTPYEGTSAAVIMTKHLSDLVPDPRSVNPGLSEGFASIVLKAMGKRPAERYGSMNELAEDLERLAAGQPVRAMARKLLAAERGGGERHSGRHDVLMRKGRVERGGSARKQTPVLWWGGTAVLAVVTGLIFLLVAAKSRVVPPNEVRPPSPSPPDKAVPPAASPVLPSALPAPPIPPRTDDLPNADAMRKKFDQLVEDLKTGDLKGQNGKVQAFLATCDDPILAARARADQAAAGRSATAVAAAAAGWRSRVAGAFRWADSQSPGEWERGELAGGRRDVDQPSRDARQSGEPPPFCGWPVADPFQHSGVFETEL